MARPKRKRRPAEQWGDYIVHITGWSWEYYCTVNPDRWSDDPISEIKTIEVEGRVLGPKSAKCESANISLAPDPRFARAERLQSGRMSIQSLGFIDKRGATLQAYVLLPESVLGPLMTAFAAERFPLLILSAPRLFRSRANVRRISIGTKFNPDEYPADYYS